MEQRPNSCGRHTISGFGTASLAKPRALGGRLESFHFALLPNCQRLGWLSGLLSSFCHCGTSLAHGWSYAPCAAFQRTHRARLSTRLGKQGISRRNYFINNLSSFIGLLGLGRRAAGRRMAACSAGFTANFWANLGNTTLAHSQPRPRTLGEQLGGFRLSHFLQRIMDHLSRSGKCEPSHHHHPGRRRRHDVDFALFGALYFITDAGNSIK